MLCTYWALGDTLAIRRPWRTTSCYIYGAQLKGGAGAETEESKYQQCEEHEHKYIKHLWCRLAKCHDDLVQPGPRLEQPEQSEQPQHPQEGNVDPSVGKEHGQEHLYDRQAHDCAIELVPTIRPVCSQGGHTDGSGCTGGARRGAKSGKHD